MRTDGGKNARDNWLLIKERDQFADPDLDPIEKWQRSVEEPPQHGGYRAGRRRAGAEAPSASPMARNGATTRLPPFVAPQLALLEDRPPEGPGWIHEIKYDGYRLHRRDHTRSGEALYALGSRLDGRNSLLLFRPSSKLNVTALIDGEVIVQDEQGLEPLRIVATGAFGRRYAAQMRYVAFDLLSLDGEDLARQVLDRAQGAC